MRIKQLLILYILIASSQLFGQEIVIGEQKKIYSETLKEDRTYFIHTPDNYDVNSNKYYPVLYVLDGDECFGIATTTVKYLSNRGFMPQTIVVGISNRRDRDRDLTPTKDNYSPTGGGADNFLSFMTNELMPAIEKEYRTLPHKSLYGASYGGLFALYVLFNHPESFDNYLAVSPSLYHDNNLVFKQAVSYFDTNPASSKFVFLSLADESWTEMRVAFKNTIDVFNAKAANANIRWSYRYYNDETHESTRLKGLNDALREMHKFWWTPFFQRDRGITGLKEHFSMLSDMYGYPIEIPQHLVNKIGYNNLRKGKLKAAKSLFVYNVEKFPDFPNVYDSMGEYYESQKEYSEAKKYFSLAVEKAKQQNINTEIYERGLKRIYEVEKSKSKTP